MKPIYKIICYNIDDVNKIKRGNISPRDFSRDREWGFYYDFAKAYKCVQENWTDIYENGYYNHVCIEETYEGITSFHNRKTYWFSVELFIGNKYKIDFIDSCFFEDAYRHGFQVTLPAF